MIPSEDFPESFYCECHPLGYRSWGDRIFSWVLDYSPNFGKWTYIDKTNNDNYVVNPNKTPQDSIKIKEKVNFT